MRRAWESKVAGPHCGKSRIRFWSSLSSTSSVRYWNWSGKRGLTENASFASRMHRLHVESVICNHQRGVERDAHVSDLQRVEGVERLGRLERAEEQTGKDLLALAPHLVPAPARMVRGGRTRPSRVDAYLHSTSPGPWMISRVRSSVDVVPMPGTGTGKAIIVNGL